MRRLYYIDKLGWPVELVKGRWFLNFLRILIHTRKYTFKRPSCLDASTLLDLSSEEVRGMVHEVIDHEQKYLRLRMVLVESDTGRLSEIYRLLRQQTFKEVVVKSIFQTL